MKLKPAVSALVAILALATAPASAQQSRAELVDAALAAADATQRFDLLIRALDPELGPPDSPWAVAAFSMAFRLDQAGRADEAGHWLRWAAREGAELGMGPADFPGLFPPPLVDAFGRARALVEAQASPADGVVASTWAWPGVFAAGADGRLELRVEGAGAGVEAEVEGVGPVTEGQPLSLPPGTYRILVGGDGVEPVAVRREILPGATRILTVAATPVLFPGAQARAERSVVRLRGGEGAAVCSSGVAPRDGVVVAPLGMLDAEGLEMVSADGRIFRTLDVALRDEALGVGVIRLGQGDVPPAEGAAGGAEGPTWALFHDGCGPVRAERVGLEAFQPRGRFPLQGAPAGSEGAALIDQQGRLVALGLGAFALSAAELDDVVERALAVVVAEPAPVVPVTAPVQRPDPGPARPPQQGGGGGGMPWKWIAAGGAAVGVAALLLGGGGGGEDTTGIRITWPGN